MNDVTLMFVVRGVQGRVLGWVTSRTWWYVRNKGAKSISPFAGPGGPWAS